MTLSEEVQMVRWACWYPLFSTDPKNISAGADPGGAPGARAPPLTLGFEAPKLSIFGPYLIFP